MRLNLFAAVLLVFALAVPRIAAADVIDDFTIVGNGLDITFSLPATTTVEVHADDNYYVFSFTEIRNGVAQPGSLGMTIEEDPCLGSLDGSQVDGIALCTYGPAQEPSYTPLWNYAFEPLSPPTFFYTGYDIFTFNPGTYLLMDIDHDPCLQPDHPSPCYLPDPQYTLTITPEAATLGATPEPGTLLLLSTGLAGGWGVLRRRKIG